MKAGTTSLWEYLGRHPDVYVAWPKEINFFIRDRGWKHGIAWYEEHFLDASADQARGEVSPDYTKADVFTGVPERMASVVPDARLIYLVRDPIERLQSHYLHRVGSGHEKRPFETAAHDAHLLNTSRYAWQLDHYLEYFDRDQIAVFTSEALRATPEETLSAACRHIGVTPMPMTSTGSVTRHQTAAKRERPAALWRVQRHPLYRRAGSMVPRSARAIGRQWFTRPIDSSRADLSPALLQELTERLGPDVARLRSFLGPEFDGWGLA